MAEEIGVPTRNDTLSVGTSSIMVTNARSPNTPRKVLIIRNTSTSSTAVITLNVGYNIAVANNGIVLRQYEVYTDADDSGYQCWQGIVTGISNEASAQLSIFER